MRLVEEPLPSDPSFGPSRSDIIGHWLSTSSANVVRAAALAYLADCGSDVDLPAIREELERGDYQTRSVAAEAIIRISLRNSREKGLLALLGTQIESIDRRLLTDLFDNGESIDAHLLEQGLKHRNAEVRLASVGLLRRLNRFAPEWTELMLSDLNALVRSEALRTLVESGRTFSDLEAKNILVKPILGSDREGEAYFDQYRERQIASMPEQMLSSLVQATGAFEDWIYFARAKHHLAVHGDALRQAVDDRFKTYFNEVIEKVARHTTDADLIKQLKGLEEQIRQGLTLKGLDIICKKELNSDLGLVRRALRDGYFPHSDCDILYLRKFGEWDDIPLILGSLAKASYDNQSLLSFHTDAIRFASAAKALYDIGRNRLPELLLLDMPNELLVHVINAIPNNAFRGLAGDLIIRLLRSEHYNVH